MFMCNLHCTVTLLWFLQSFYVCLYLFIFVDFFSLIFLFRRFLSIPLRFSTETVMHSSAILWTIRWHYFYHVFTSLESIFAFDSCRRCYAVIFETYMFRLTWMGHFPVVVLLSLFFFISLIAYLILYCRNICCNRMLFSQCFFSLLIRYFVCVFWLFPATYYNMLFARSNHCGSNIIRRIIVNQNH